MTMPTLTQSEFSLGSVTRQSLSVLARNLVRFVSIYLVVNAPSMVVAFSASERPDADVENTIRLLSLVETFVGLVAAATITFGTVHELRGRHLTVGEFVSRGVAQGGAAIGASFLSGLAILLGLILLVVPGIVLYIVLWVAIPAAVIERPGAAASLNRSAELTKGYRWRVFGLAIGFILAMVALGLLIGVIVGVFVGLAFPFDSHLLDRVTTVVEWLVTALFMASQAVLCAVTYYHLRVAKEGVSIDDIAAVFD